MVMGLLVGLSGIRHTLRLLSIYVWANLLWLLLTLPILTAPAAWAGLCRMSYVAHRRDSAHVSDFWDGFRAHWKGGIVLSLIGIVVIGVNVTNLLGFTRDTSLAGMALRLIWLMTLIAWFGIQLYAFPLLPAMDKPTLWGAYRNAAVMALHNPLFTLGMWLMCLPILVLTAIFPAAFGLFSFSAFASIGNSAVQNRLVVAGFQQMPEPPAPLSPTADEVYL